MIGPKDTQRISIGGTKGSKLLSLRGIAIASYVVAACVVGLVFLLPRWDALRAPHLTTGPRAESAAFRSEVLKAVIKQLDQQVEPVWTLRRGEYLRPARSEVVPSDDDEMERKPLIRPIPISYRKHESRAIVVAYHTEDLSWLPLYFPDLQAFVYSSNDTAAPHHQPHPLGKEAGAFLAFILDYYDNLPDKMVFVHAHRYSYHTWTNDIVNALSRLRWDRVTGYTPINLNEFHRLQQGYYNFDYMREHWTELFGDTFGTTAPTYMDHYCCAQFAVRRQDILLRSREFYERLYRLVFDPTAQVDVPRVMEHAWHFILGEPFITVERNVCEIMYCEPGDSGRGELSGLVRSVGLPTATSASSVREVLDAGLGKPAS